MLGIGTKEPLQSPYISPVARLKKSDQCIKFCFDFRNFIKLTVFGEGPIPNRDEIFSKLATCKYFTKMT